ncbi:MAG TPA: DNA-3-methyladenine glycosylase 2 family protein [Alphaproteobacteria bacterium]|nr:DNA-3-methyladenine glycosylase 2 family protein [Alphaproteobacteria bacterium]
MTTATWWLEGQKALAKADPKMALLIRQYPKSELKSRGAELETLQRAITGQQISTKAAASIWARVVARVGDVNSPQAWLNVPEADLRACGFSGQKVKYVRGIAEGFAGGTVHPPKWQNMTDEQIIAELVKLPGIGRWTAEMYLMFNLLRPDVLAVDDLGLLKGFEKTYGPVRGTKTLIGLKRWRKIGVAMKKHAELWRPYRTLACWYLWRSLDPVETGY